MESRRRKVKKQSLTENTCVTCGRSHKKMLPVTDINNWKVIWNAAQLRRTERILALGSADELPENVMYGSECRKSFVHKRTIDRMKIRRSELGEVQISSESEVPVKQVKLSKDKQMKPQNESQVPRKPKILHSKDIQEKPLNENVKLLGKNKKLAVHNRVLKRSLKDRLITSRIKFKRQHDKGRQIRSKKLVTRHRKIKEDAPSVLKNFYAWNRVINAVCDTEILKFTCNEQVANETHCSCYRKYTQADNNSKGKYGHGQRQEMDVCVDYESVEAKAYSALFEYIREKSFSPNHHSEVMALSDLIDILCSNIIASGVRGVRDSTKKNVRRKIETEFGKSVLFVKTDSGIVYLMKSTICKKDPDNGLDTQHEMEQTEKKSVCC